MKIFGVTVIRDEADIVAATLRYHLSLGLRRILVLDNGSSDGTDQVLKQLERADRRIQSMRYDGEFQQGALLTRLAREAFEARADWIVPFDADEFWYAPLRPFAEILLNSDAGALRAPVIHYVQAREQSRRGPEALLSMTRRARRTIGPPDRARAMVEAQQIGYVEAMYPPKTIVRATAELEIGAGSHTVSNLAGPAETTVDLVCLHAPLRSRDIFPLKVAHSRRLEQARRPLSDGWHTHRVRRLADEDSIEAEWAANSYTDAGLDVYGIVRPVVFDPTLRDAVAPHIESGRDGAGAEIRLETPAADRVAWQSSILQDFLTALHDDALERTIWASGLDEQLVRARAVIEELHRELGARTEWARSLDDQLTVGRKILVELHNQVAERTASARAADEETQKLLAASQKLLTSLPPPASDMSESRGANGRPREADGALRDGSVGTNNL